MKDDERVDSCHRSAPLKVKYLLLDLFLLHWQDRFWQNLRISSSSWIQSVEFRVLFLPFWIILSSLLDEITHKDMATCLGFGACFHVCLPLSLLSLLPLDVHTHTHTHVSMRVYTHTHAQVHNDLQKLTCGHLGQHPSRLENGTSPETFLTAAVWNSTRWTASVSKEFLIGFCRMDAKQSLISVSTISLETQSAFWRMGRDRY